MVNLFRFKIWLQTMISVFFAHFSTLFPKFRSQILQYHPLIGILLKYFQIPIQICRLNGNGFRNGELIEIQNLVSNNDFTIFRKSFNTISPIPQPNIAIPTSHRYTLKVLSNTYPNMPTNIYGNINGNGFRNGELAEVQNLAASTYFTIFRTFFITFSQNAQSNIAMPTCH